MVSGLLICCLVAIAVANPVPMDNDTVPYPNHGAQDIINGDDAKYGLFNSILSLRDRGFHICAASLISSTRALTAAHCIDSSYTYTVVAGELHFDQNSGHEVTKAVKEIIVHDKYREDDYWKNDIAILKFDPIPLGTYIQPIELVKKGSLAKEKCMIAGWGRTVGALPRGSRMLQYTDMYVMTNKDCRRQMKNGIRDTNICLQNFQRQATACKGDSGGPLTCPVKGVTKLAGLSSWGRTGCPGTMPTVYTRVSRYQMWIKKNM